MRPESGLRPNSRMARRQARLPVWRRVLFPVLIVLALVAVAALYYLGERLGEHLGMLHFLSARMARDYEVCTSEICFILLLMVPALETFFASLSLLSRLRSGSFRFPTPPPTVGFSAFASVMLTAVLVAASVLTNHQLAYRLDAPLHLYSGHYAMLWGLSTLCALLCAQWSAWRLTQWVYARRHRQHERMK